MCHCLACSHPPQLSPWSPLPKHFTFNQLLSCNKALTGRKCVCLAVSKLFLVGLLDRVIGSKLTNLAETHIPFYLEKHKIHFVHIKPMCQVSPNSKYEITR